MGCACAGHRCRGPVGAFIRVCTALGAVAVPLRNHRPCLEPGCNYPLPAGSGTKKHRNDHVSNQLQAHNA